MCAIACDAVAAPGITQPTPPILITAHRVEQFIDARYTRFVRPIFFRSLQDRIFQSRKSNKRNSSQKKKKKKLKTANADAIYGQLNIHHQCR